MSELVVFVLCASSVAVVVSHARSLVGSTARRRELDRMLAAVERAGSDFLTQETRLLAALLGVLAAALCVPLLLWGLRQPQAGARLVAGVLGVLLGGAAGAALARLSHWAAARASARALADLQAEPEAASAAVLRGALLLALAMDAASLLLTCLAFLGYQRFASWVLQLEPAAALQEATRSQPLVALGAIGAALVFQVGGSSFQTAARVQSATERNAQSEGRISVDEEQNPALVAELVGDHLAGLVSRSTDVFAAMMLANVSLLALSGAVAAANAGLTESSGLALVALPLLIRATGLLAVALATSSLRIGPGSSSWSGFAGAGLSQALIAATGLLGGAFWLLGAPLYLRAFSAGLLGIVTSLICQALLLVPRGGSTLGVLASGSAASVAWLPRALGLGLQRAWAPLLVAVAGLGAAHALGAGTGLSHGGAYTLLLAVAGMAGAGALHLCCSAFGSIASSVRRLAALRRAHYDLPARSRAAELEQAGLIAGNLGDIQVILCGTAAALLGALTLPLLGLSRAAASPAFSSSLSSSSTLSPALSLAHPVVMLGVILGLACLSCYVGGVLQSASRAASAVDEELSREQAEAASQVELDPQPATSYRGSVVRAGRVATRKLLPLPAAALLAPMVMGVSLRLLFGVEGSRLAGHGLMAVAIITVLTGGCAALAARGVLMALGHTRQGAAMALGPGGPLPQPARSGMDLMRTLIGHSVGPAALLGLKATVVSALVIVPLLSPPV